MATWAGLRPWCLNGDWSWEKRTATERSGEAAFLAEGTVCTKVWRREGMRHIREAKCLDDHSVHREESGKS